MKKLVQFFQEKVIFLPTLLPHHFEYDLNCPYQEYYLETPGSGRINALHFEVEKPKGVVLYFHGNADNLHRWAKHAEEFTHYGYDVFVMDYRGYGKSLGPRNEELLFADAQFCYDYLREKYTEEKIVVYGRSLGGTFATKVASDNSPQKVILECTFYNLQDMANRYIPNLITTLLSPIFPYHLLSNEFIRQIKSPLCFFHGTEDVIVPLKSGKKLFDAFAASQPEVEKKFVEIQGGGHNNLAEFEIYQKEISRFLQ